MNLVESYFTYHDYLYHPSESVCFPQSVLPPTTQHDNRQLHTLQGQPKDYFYYIGMVGINISKEGPCVCISSMSGRAFGDFC